VNCEWSILVKHQSQFTIDHSRKLSRIFAVQECDATGDL